MSSLVGRTLSRYEILGEISRGGMGVVYRAHDTRLNRDVALKVLPPELVADADRRARFVQEAQAASAIEHPHIAVIHEIDEAEGVSFIAMELVRGEKLSAETARGPMVPARALDLAIEIAEGLARAHDRGILHRDLKPANVMVTEDGHAKVIDFGLAKLVEPLGADSAQGTMMQTDTAAGLVVGTVAYMSPEQARGAKVDHRTDVFSCGVVLHEMLTGRPPFRGATGIDTMHAILHDPVPPLPPLGSGISSEATQTVQRILDKCLAKDPAERYQGMRDLVVDLRAARRRLESSSVAPLSSSAVTVTPREGSQTRRQYVHVGVAALVLVLVGIGWLWSRSVGAPAPTGAPGNKPAVAVLYFENNTGNPDLDWLRTGLTDMLVTDLSQSTHVEVLGTDRLVQILGDLKRLDDKAISFDTVREIGRRAGINTVVLGSYVKAGDAIRINIKLQEPSTGRIMSAERVEAIGESNLFPMVDELTKRIRARFVPDARNAGATLLPAPTDPNSGDVLDRALRDVATASIEAYRYYSEGVNLHDRGRDIDAIPQLEKAVQADPNFALAHMKLAVAHGNMLHFSQQREAAKRALDLADRLPARDRDYVEAYYYGLDPATMDKAIAAYRRAIELFPNHESARHNLGTDYLLLERWDEAIEQFEALRQRNTTFPETYGGLANAYGARGETEKGIAAVREFISRNPESSLGYLDLARMLTVGGKWDDAQAALDRALGLEPRDPFPLFLRRSIFIVRDQWTEYSEVNRTLRESTEVSSRAFGLIGEAVGALYRGRSSDAAKAYERAVRESGPRGNATATAAAGLAEVLLERDQPAAALAEAERSRDVTDALPLRFGAEVLVGIAQARLKRFEEARQTADRLASNPGLAQSRALSRFRNLIEGRVALERGDTAAAIDKLRDAESSLPVHLIAPLGPTGRSATIWYWLGAAYLAAHDDANAAAHFQRIVDSGAERANRPIEFVKSLYYLGQIAERRGNRARAGEHYRQFLNYWGDGDLARELVADARRKADNTAQTNR